MHYMSPEDVVSKFLHAQTNIMMSSHQATALLAGVVWIRPKKGQYLFLFSIVSHLFCVSFEPKSGYSLETNKKMSLQTLLMTFNTADFVTTNLPFK